MPTQAELEDELADILYPNSLDKTRAAKYKAKLRELMVLTHLPLQKVEPEVSAWQTITLNTVYTFTHALAVHPRNTVIEIKCISTDLGYAADVIISAFATQYIAVEPSDEDVKLTTVASGALFYILSKTTKALSSIDIAKWELRVRIIA